MKVSFMIIGAQKCGTTTLFDILSTHPFTTPCKVKEPQFFSKVKNWKKELSSYEALFNPMSEDTLLFEASTSYTFLPIRNLCIWNDIYEYNPYMKFIYLVRNPIDRIISGYMHSYERGYTDKTIDEEIISRRNLVDFTRYYTQINPFIQKFGKDKVLIIDFDDFINNRVEILFKISRFLEIESSYFHDFNDAHSNMSIGGKKNHHRFKELNLLQKVTRKAFPLRWESFLEKEREKRSFSGKPSLSPELREVIIDMLLLEIREIETLMNKKLNHWKVI